MKYKTILITGGAGFVGSNLALKFRDYDKSINIIVLDNLYRRGSELSLKILKDKGIVFIYGDVRQRLDLLKIKFDLLIECSAEPSFKAGMSGDTDYLVQTNLDGAINCFEACKKNNADVIFLSTSRVYPIDQINDATYIEEETRFSLSKDQIITGISENGFSEQLGLGGHRSFYGATKLSAEYMLSEYLHSYNLKGIINRFGTIAGPMQLGKVDQGVITFWLVSHMLNKPLAYIGYGGEGKQVRDIIHIDDVFNLLVLQLNHIESISGDIFNVGGGLSNAISLAELTKICQEITGKKISVGSIAETVKWDLKSYISDNRKILKTLGWKPSKSVREIIVDTYEWLLSDKEILEFFKSSL